jgi:hypothetical protein
MHVDGGAGGGRKTAPSLLGLGAGIECRLVVLPAGAWSTVSSALAAGVIADGVGALAPGREVLVEDVLLVRGEDGADLTGLPLREGPQMLALVGTARPCIARGGRVAPLPGGPHLLGRRPKGVAERLVLGLIPLVDGLDLPLLRVGEVDPA